MPLIFKEKENLHSLNVMSAVTDSAALTHPARERLCRLTGRDREREFACTNANEWVIND